MVRRTHALLRSRGSRRLLRRAYTQGQATKCSHDRRLCPNPHVLEFDAEIPSGAVTVVQDLRSGAASRICKSDNYFPIRRLGAVLRQASWIALLRTLFFAALR